jgi:hypothetical protein
MAERGIRGESRPAAPEVDTARLSRPEPTTQRVTTTRDDTALFEADLDPADLLDAPTRTPLRADADGEQEVSLSGIEDAEPGAMYLDPAGAYDGLLAAVADAEEAVDRAEGDYYEVLRDVEQVAHDYQEAIESGDPVALQVAQARLQQLQDDAERLRQDLDDAESGLDQAVEARNTFEADHPDLVEEITGLTPEQHRDLDELHELQDAVSQAEAELAALDDTSFDQQLAAQQAAWNGEKDAAGHAVTAADAQVDAAAGGVMAQLNAVVVQMGVEAAHDPLAANASLGLITAAMADPDSLAQLQADLADPETDPHVALATFLDGAPLLPADHPLMMQLEQQFDELADARGDLADAEARRDTAEAALASLDVVGDEHQARRDEVEQELEDAQQALDAFEQQHPDLAALDTDELDAAEREADAVESARLAHLENTLDDLGRLDEQIEDGDGALAGNVGLATFVTAEAGATDTLDDTLQAAEQEVEAAEAAADTAEDVDGAETLPPTEVATDALVRDPSVAYIDIDFGTGRTPTRAPADDGADDDTTDDLVTASPELFEITDPPDVSIGGSRLVEGPDLLPEPMDLDERDLPDDGLDSRDPGFDLDL